MSREQANRRKKADAALAVARDLNRKADQIADAHRRLRQKNHFSQAIFGSPRD